MPKYFGTDGFRGEANKDLTVEHAYKIGRYLGYYYGKDHRARIVIGKDTRRSSYMFEYALVAGITASGADAFLLHVTTTPNVAYIVRTEDFDCGIMVSASHNPFYDNGIKILNEKGHKIELEIELELEDYIDGIIQEIPMAEKENIGRVSDYIEGRNRYIDYLESLPSHSIENLKIGLDCSNGSSFQVARRVFESLGAVTYIIGNEPDGLNINKECGSTNTGKLQALIKEKKLDIGFAYDGDADRCIAIDENGRELNGDYIIYICAKYLKDKGMLLNNTVVATVMSNLGLFKALDEIGIQYKTTAVGDKYVNECMVNNGYQLGGEQSGHIIFSRFATTGDGILTSLMLIDAMMEMKKPLSVLAESMKMYPQKLKNISVSNKKAVMSNEQVVNKHREIEKALVEHGRIILRESGTEPVIRVMVEAANETLCNYYIEEMISTIKMEGLA